VRTCCCCCCCQNKSKLSRWNNRIQHIDDVLLLRWMRNENQSTRTEPSTRATDPPTDSFNAISSSDMANGYCCAVMTSASSSNRSQFTIDSFPESRLPPICCCITDTLLLLPLYITTHWWTNEYSRRRSRRSSSTCKIRFIPSNNSHIPQCKTDDDDWRTVLSPTCYIITALHYII